MLMFTIGVKDSNAPLISSFLLMLLHRDYGVCQLGVN